MDDWSRAAGIVSERWVREGRLSLPPDDPSGDDDLKFWAEVEQALKAQPNPPR